MCLETVYRGKKKKEKLAKLPDVITVWKVVKKWGPGDYGTDCKDFPLHAGEVEFKQNIINGEWFGYKGGGHFFLSRRAAYRWRDGYGSVVKCTIKKEWINSIGEQDGKVVVVKRAIFPAYMGKGTIK